MKLAEDFVESIPHTVKHHILEP